MKYFSYGMNTNPWQMARRCPTAESLGAAVLSNHRFEFKGFATVDVDYESDVDGVLWEIQPADEAALDVLEGYPYYYDKKMVDVIVDGVTVQAMTYFMYPDEVLRMPSNSYYNLVADGYEEHGIVLDQINDAIDRVEVKYRLTADAV